MFPRVTLLSLLILFGCLQSWAQGLGDRAQAVLDGVRESGNLPGITAAILKDGEVFWSGASGYADVERRIPASGGTAHRIASISKPMTAVAVMQLVEQNKVDLDAPIQTYLPGYPVKADGPITVRHLLSHTSGMGHYEGRENRPTKHYETFDQAMAVFQDRPLKFAPGKGFNYTTYGYTVLGAIIEAASGLGYEAYMREHVWKPAGMESTQLDVKGRAISNRMKGYRRTRDSFTDDMVSDQSVKYPGGGILSTAEDLVRFAGAFQSGILLPEEARQTMFTVPELPDRALNYGLGWVLGKSEEFGPFYAHDGGQDGTSTNLVVYPDAGVAVAVIVNLYRANPAVMDATFGLARLAME